MDRTLNLVDKSVDSVLSPLQPHKSRTIAVDTRADDVLGVALMNASELQSWRKALGISREDAAAALGLSLTGFLNQLYGHRPVSRQTERLAAFVAANHLALRPGEKIVYDAENSH